MEIVIVICLLIVIVLLLHDKVIIKKVTKKETGKEKPKIKLPDIMGVPKPVRRLSASTKASESQDKKEEAEADNFEPEIEKKDLDKQIPQEELDEVFGEVPDLQEEEEEWYRYEVSDDEDGFATGVTFEELSAVGMLLQQDVLEPSQQNTAVRIVHKLQGTELFSLLENSMEGASRKIAELLDRSLSSETESRSSIMRNNNVEDFDIGDFV